MLFPNTKYIKHPFSRNYRSTELSFLQNKKVVTKFHVAQNTRKLLATPSLHRSSKLYTFSLFLLFTTTSTRSNKGG